MIENRAGARTLADVALTEMREAILSGELAPGTPVRLQDQVERLQMSSVPIREALRFLEQSGLVDRTPHRGAYVAEMSAEDLEEAYTIRLELESMAVRLTAERITDEGRQHLMEVLKRYDESTQANTADARERHADLHRALYQSSGSKWLLRLLPMLWDSTERYRRMALKRTGTAPEWVSEHRKIVELCAAGDPDGAEEAMRSHLQHTFEVAVAKLREEEAAAAKTSSG